MNYAEFCTGVGGFRLGIEMSGIDLKSVYANEIDEYPVKTFEENFNIKVSADSTIVDARSLLALFTLIGKRVNLVVSDGADPKSFVRFAKRFA